MRRPAAPISPSPLSWRWSATCRAICCSAAASSRRAGSSCEPLARELADGPPILVGLPEPNPSDEGRPLFNTAALLRGGRIEQRFRKALLPTYDVFDEDRYFEPFHGAQVLDIGGTRLGISICEDVWNDRDFWKRRRYHHDPIEELVRAGAQAIVNLSASPFTAGKHALREEMLGSMARKSRRAARLRESVRRQRRSGVRRPQLRLRRRRARRSRAAAAFDADVIVCDLVGADTIGPADRPRR